ncbi:MAG: hypothetical protein AB9873_17800 [Syntrophobacteraceae bacterium]
MNVLAKINAMIGAHDAGPRNTHCGGCGHITMSARRDREKGAQYACRKWDCGPKPKFHRLTWQSCGLYESAKAPARLDAEELILVVCPAPGCGAKRELNRSYVESHPNFDRRCHACVKANREQSTTKAVPVFNGCRPVMAGDGKRCEKSYGCPSYSACLDHAAYRLWPGFRASSDPAEKRVHVPEIPKRAYTRRAQA